MYFDGSCPFLLCIEQEPHTHPICPLCGAVKFGNVCCETCRKNWEKELQKYWDQLKKER